MYIVMETVGRNPTFLMEDRIWRGVEQTQVDKASDTVSVTLTIVYLRNRKIEYSNINGLFYFVSESSSEKSVSRVDSIQFTIDCAVSVGVAWITEVS